MNALLTKEDVLTVILDDICPMDRYDVLKQVFRLKHNSIDDILVNDKPLTFSDRFKAETDNSKIQLVRMAYFYRKNKDNEIEVYGCKRISKSGETRLHDTYTILFGGHTSQEDKSTTLDATLQTALLRELDEELDLPSNLIQSKPVINIIYTPDVYTVNVSNYHASDIVAFNLTDLDELKIKETTKLSEGRFYTLEELHSLNLESWAALIVSTLKNI